jgi:predicted 3-demethylubiquinone-9 3-methyltransferase (glyoxalase superfamily)
MQKIIPFLWFDGKAEEATHFYVSIFKHSKVNSINRMGKDGPVISTSFELDGQTFHALNGGPKYQFTPAISLFVNCYSQEEVDELWEKLMEGGGEESRCGWLLDKYGMSWQIIPTQLGELLLNKDPQKAQTAMQAMMKMNKIDIKGLEGG